MTRRVTDLQLRDVVRLGSDHAFVAEVDDNRSLLDRVLLTPVKRVTVTFDRMVHGDRITREFPTTAYLEVL